MPPRRQFPEGDVQHWWLPRTGAGVRTMISDDVVWLAHATARYMQVTGDSRILEESNCPSSRAGRWARASTMPSSPPKISKETATLYDHCARALDLAIKRSSPAGLPLILGGDWNDGMNRVGEHGQGRERLARLVPAEDAGRLRRRRQGAKATPSARKPGQSMPTR